MAFFKPKILILFWLGVFAAVSPPPTSVANPGQTDEKDNSPQISIKGEIKSTNGSVAGASVYVFRNGLVAESVANDNGSFEFQHDSDDPVKMLIVAEDKIRQIYSLDPSKETKPKITLKEQKKSLSGRIIDNQGMGVADAELRLSGLIHKSETIEIPTELANGCFNSMTDQDGVFQFDGIDPSMIGSIQVSGQGIVSTSLTRQSFENEIVLVVQPARTVQGKVFDRDSKLSISNVRVSAAGGAIAETNGSGEFKLKGLPAFQSLLLTAEPQGDEPFLLKAERVPIENGFDSVDIQIGLEPGVWVKCKVRDFGTTGPASANVYYFPTPENEDFQSFIESFVARGFVPPVSTSSTGDARVVAIAGPGVIAVSAEGFPPNESVNKLTDEQRAMLQQVTGGNALTAVAWIDPKDLKDEIELGFLVSKGRTIDVELDENQLDTTSRLVVHRAASKTSYAQSVIGSKFAGKQFQPGETREILIHAPLNGLGGILNLKAESKSPVQFALEPTGSLVGQVVDKNGDPQPGLLMKFEVSTADGFKEIATQVFTDANGRFKKPSLIASVDYRVAAVRLTLGQQMMMKGSPEMDSRWYVAEDLKIDSGESVDLGEMVLGATSQPDPKRQPMSLARDKEIAVAGMASPNSASSDSAPSDSQPPIAPSPSFLPPVIRGMVTNESGRPVAGAMVSFNTWPNRVGDPEKDIELSPVVLTQSRSDSNGDFQMSIDAGLQGKLILAASDSDQPGKPNAAVVVVVKKYGAMQIPLQEMSDPSNLKIQLAREMIVRGNVSGEIATNPKARLMVGSPMRVYDADSISQIVAGLQEGVSLEKLSEKYEPISTLDPQAGGLPLAWETSSSGAFIVRNIPINAIFELHAIGNSGRKAIVVISRPIRGFDIKLSDESPGTTTSLQGSRIKLDLSQKVVEE